MEFTIDRWPNGFVTVRCGPMALYLSPNNFETLFRALSCMHSSIQAEKGNPSLEELRH